MSLKLISTLIATSVALSFPISSFANSVGATIIKGPRVVTSFTTSPSVLGPHGIRDFNTSETAAFFYRRGVKKLDKGKLEQAEEAFRASLRADGSKNLDSFSLHYLAYISNKRGNKAKAQEYAQAYLKLNNLKSSK